MNKIEEDRFRLSVNSAAEEGKKVSMTLTSELAKIHIRSDGFVACAP